MELWIYSRRSRQGDRCTSSRRIQTTTSSASSSSDAPKPTRSASPRPSHADPQRLGFSTSTFPRVVYDFQDSDNTCGDDRSAILRIR